MVETPATASRSAVAPALPVAVQALVVVPVASSIPADAPAPISEASIPELPPATKSSLAYGLHITTTWPLSVDAVLAAIQPLPDALADLPRMVGELQDKLRSDEAEAAAVRHFVTSALMAQENLEQYLRTEKAQVKSYQIENRRLREANTRTAALLVKTKEPIAGHNENLRLLRLQIQDRDNTIVGLSQQVTKERETFKAAIGANTE
ncbi:hypothetical protein PC128_g13846 [Phytophthora cactorum]|nr:hypothetical protein PC128_g13846 [Phytophthora cactorum]